MSATDRAQHHREVAAQALADAARFAPEDPLRAMFVAEAQVHALLAVSEEQRTANLLAGAGFFAYNDSHRLDIGVRVGLA